MALTPQLMNSLHKLHPDFAADVNENGLWRGTYPISLVHSSTLKGLGIHQDFEGKDDYLSSLGESMRKGGLREPVMLQHGIRPPTTWLTEGHHRVEAAERMGGLLLPTIAHVSQSGHSLGRPSSRIIQPNEHGWFPKYTDPDRLIQGVR